MNKTHISTTALCALGLALAAPLHAAVIYSDNFDDNINTGWTYLDRNGATEIANAVWVETGGRLEQQTANYDFVRDTTGNDPALGTIALSGSGVVGGEYTISLAMDSLENTNNFQDQVIVFSYIDVDNFYYVETLNTNNNTDKVVLQSVVGGQRSSIGNFGITFDHDLIDVSVTIDTSLGEVSASYNGGVDTSLATGLTLAAGLNGVGSNNDAFAIDNYSIDQIPEPGSLSLLGVACLVALRRRRA